MSLKEKIISLAHEYLIDIQEIRRYINSHPEESFKEFGTALFIERKLDEWGISHKRVAETGITAAELKDMYGDWYDDLTLNDFETVLEECKAMYFIR